MKMRWISLLVLSAAVALGLAPAAQADVRVGPNYRLAADKAPFRFQDQPGLAVNPGNPNHVVAVNANYLDSDCETSVSTDGGSTWSPPVSLRPPSGQNFRQWCHNTVGTNQTVEFGTGQNVYTAVAAQRDVPGAGFLEDAAALVYKSTDGGVTWQEGVVAMGGGPGGLDPNTTPGPAWYRPSIGVDRAAGAGGADRIHIVARDIRSTTNGACPSLPGSGCSPIKAAVSENGGLTFSAPVRLGPAGINANDFPSKPVVNPDHSVTVAWRLSAPTAAIQAVKRNPQTGEWSEPRDVTTVVNTGTTVPSHVTPSPSNSGTYPRMDVDRANGKLYMVYTQGPGGPNPPTGGYTGADHWMANALQVYFQRSSDGGVTWTAPKRISEATSFPGARTHQTRHANISVSPNGRINVIWQDRRHWYMGPGERDCRHSHVFCEDIRLGDTYYSYSTDNGSNFVKPIRINDRSHNNDVGVDTRPSGYWWFAPQVVTVGNDQKTLIAWMDSREGNWETDTSDIYLAKVDFNASGAVPQTSVANASDSISRSVGLSKFGYQGGPEGALVGNVRDVANPPGCTAAQCPGGPATRNATSVVIANQTDTASALAGAVLARANPGPVLLSAAGGLSAAVKAEVARVHPARAFVIGDAGRLSEQVRTDVAAAAGIPVASVVRVSGGSDAATAAQIAALMDARSPAEKAANVPAFDAAVIANPASPHAAAVAGLAAARRLPVLYADGNSIPAATQAALQSLNIDKTLVIGNSSVVTDAGLPSPTRLGGATQYETSQAVVNESKARGLPTNVVAAADGARPVEAAVLGAAVARVTGIMLLAPAPLYNTVPGQASAFGLGDVARFFLAGPPRPGTTGPRPRPTPTTPAAPAAFPGCPTLTANVIRGTAAANTINGTTGADRIFAATGNDVVDALAGNDCVDLGAGDDRGQGGLGNDLMVSGAGKDVVSGSAGNDNMRGNDGNDRLEGGRGNDRATGDAGNDTLLGSFGNDVLLGSGGKDKIAGSRGRDAINGGSSNDKISGGSSADKIKGGSGKDRINGNSGADRIAGNSGADRITSRDSSRDRVNCGSGRDTVIADRKDKVSRNCERVIRRR